MDDVFIARNQLTKLKFILHEYREKLWKKPKFMKKKIFFFAKFCLGDHNLIEESNLPGLVL